MGRRSFQKAQIFVHRNVTNVILACFFFALLQASKRSRPFAPYLPNPQIVEIAQRDQIKGVCTLSGKRSTVSTHETPVYSSYACCPRLIPGRVFALLSGFVISQLCHLPSPIDPHNTSPRGPRPWIARLVVSNSKVGRILASSLLCSPYHRRRSPPPFFTMPLTILNNLIDPCSSPSTVDNT